MPFAKLPGAQLHYEWSGPEHAPVVLFSNSLGGTLEMWNYQVAEFSKDFRVLRYDTRGHGQSSVTPGPYTIEQLSNDVLHLLDALQLEKVCFCGLSMGGTTGMFLGAHATRHLQKIVLCNTAAKIGTAESWNARIKAVREFGMKSIASAVIERWMSAAFRKTHPAEASAALAMLEAANPQGYAANCAAIRDADLSQSLHNVGVPTLVVAGTRDSVTTPADARFLADNIPGAGYVELVAAHLSNIEAQADFNREVLSFLRA
jgi:3-oxoadipate enol-lactonase